MILLNWIADIDIFTYLTRKSQNSDENVRWFLEEKIIEENSTKENRRKQYRMDQKHPKVPKEEGGWTHSLV